MMGDSWVNKTDSLFLFSFFHRRPSHGKMDEIQRHESERCCRRGGGERVYRRPRQQFCLLFDLRGEEHVGSSMLAF